MKKRFQARRLKRFALPAMALLCSAVLLVPACSRGGSSGSYTAPLADTGTLIPMSGGHVAISLRDYEGNSIDLQRDTKPFSPRQTCGYCHNYETIEQGYHFQQGTEYLADNYGQKNGTYDFVLSPGMVGKW
jgi:hypothetical protein